MKILKTSILFLIAIIVTPALLISRGNPVMVIELDCNPVEEPGLKRKVIDTRAVPILECMNGTCPVGYIIDTDANDCECIPDCAALFPDCVTCTDFTDVSWQRDMFGERCGCLGEGPVDCGCPPWLTDLNQNNPQAFIADCGILPSQPCYNGSLTLLPFENICNNLDENGMDTLTILIAIEQRVPADPTTGYGNMVSITQLQNCELSNGQNFVTSLAAQYGASAVFVDDDNDGMIELEFLRDPTQATVIDFDQNTNDNTSDIIIPACAPAPIPTLSTWMVIILGLVMSIGGLLVVKRRRVRAFLNLF